jgi:hypothetical protein
MSDDDDQPDLFSPHTRARWSDPDTSHQAAGKIEYKMTELRATVLQHFVHWTELTDLELESLCANHGSTYRTRRSELTEMGYIADTGRRKLQKGSNRIVWTITPEGLSVARVLGSAP